MLAFEPAVSVLPAGRTFSASASQPMWRGLCGSLALLLLLVGGMCSPRPAQGLNSHTWSVKELCMQAIMPLQPPT